MSLHVTEETTGVRLAATQAHLAHEHAAGHGAGASLAAMALCALGVVFGDIGTSPLYTLKECLHAAGGEKASVADLYGILSLMFWALVMVVTVKYLIFIMRADHNGEGGIFALLAIVPERFRACSPHSGKVTAMALLAVIGASLLYGDGVITPAISVLSAVEGLAVASRRLEPLVVPLTCIILIALFAIQRRGTGDVGKLFGPIMVVWFVTMASLGVYQIIHRPEILTALSPHHGALFFYRRGIHSMLILGSVVLAVTGGEALYADMGHFGIRPIRLGWTFFVLPSLVLGYLGQGRAPSGRWQRDCPRRTPYRKPFLRPGAQRNRHVLARRAIECRYRHRLAGPDIGCILAYPPGDAPGLSAPRNHQAHRLPHRGPDLYPGSQ